MRAAARDEPAQFAGIVAKLLPKDIQHNVTHELSGKLLEALRLANAATPTSPSVQVIDGVAETVSDEAKPLITQDTHRSKDLP